MTSLATSIQADLAGLIPGYDPIATAGDCWFDEAAAEKALSFFPDCLTHVKGELARTPFILEPWESAIIANMFGWKRPDGSRRYREVFIYVPRKNGKTCVAAGIVLLVLFTDGEAGAEIYSAAADRDQAVLVFAQAEGMVLQDEDMSARTQIYKTGKSIVFGNSSYKAISAEANTKHGYNTHLAVIDELHAQPNRELVDVLTTSTGARRQPLIVHITTADFDKPSICNEKLDYASKVRDGIIEDPSFLPVIYEAAIDDDWTSPEVWAKANPNLGVSVSLEYLERECERAKNVPAYENTFKRLHLNIRTEQDVRWLGVEKWDACKEPVPHLVGKRCIAGLDLSTKSDITALVLLFRNEGMYSVLPYFWIPSARAHDKETQDRVPYLTWQRQGFIEFTPGDVVDYEFIRAKVNELAGVYEFDEIAADPWNAQQLLTQLIDDGHTVVEIRQGFKTMSPAMKEFEGLILDRKIAHGGNPILRWMFSNLAVKTDAAGNIKPDKEKSTQRIDGIAALLNALSRWTVKQEDRPSVYEDRGLRIL